MDTALSGYVRALRAAGAEASSAEVIDAARAVAIVGYADRDKLRDALGLALAKTQDEKQIHELVFDRYFALQEAAVGGDTDQDSDDSAQANGDSGAGASAPAGPAAAGDAAAGNGSSTPELAEMLALAAGAAGGAGTGQSGANANALQLALRTAGVAAKVDDIRFATQIPYLTQRVLQALGAGVIDNRLAQLLDERTEAARAEAAALRGAREALQGAARRFVADRFELYGRPATESFMTEVALQRPMGRIAPAEMARIKAAVARMARKLASRHSRRQRRQRHGQLDMRRTLRGNAGHDGMPFDIIWKQRRRDKPRIVAVCDVSGSVASYVRFLLLFLYALHDCVDQLRSFAFSSHLREVGEPLEAMPFDDAMDLILRKVGLGSTDYGQAWFDLHANYPDSIDRRTTVIVLGDGRSNGTDPRLDLFADMADRARRIVWLNPEHPGRWGTGDSAMLRYRPYCSSLKHCRTAMDLERVLDDVLQSYH